MTRSPGKTHIDYKKTKTHVDGHRDRRGNPIFVPIYWFYPDGIWDEDKLTKAEAEAKYPPSQYSWTRIKD